MCNCNGNVEKPSSSMHKWNFKGGEQNNMVKCTSCSSIGFDMQRLNSALKQWRPYWLYIEPRSEKTGLWGFRPGPTQTRLYSYRRWLDT